MVKACRDIPGQELFQYYDADGSIKSIDSGMVNNYIKEICSGQFTAKDFRTWTGTIMAFLAFKKIGAFESIAEAKRNILAALDIVSKQLGNTRNVCKKYYVHPILLKMYEAGTLATYFSKLDKGHLNNLASGLSPEEQMVIKILKSS